MRIILKPGGLIALLLGFSLLAATVAYTRLSDSHKSEKSATVPALSTDTLPDGTNEATDKIDEKRHYWLVNRGSGAALDIWEKSAFEGAWTCVQPKGNATTQQWNLRRIAEDSSLSFVNANSGKILQSTSAKLGDNVSQGLPTKPTSLGQRWRLEPEGDYYYVYNQKTRLVLGVGTLPGTTAQWVLQQKKESDNQMQQWQLVVVH